MEKRNEILFLTEVRAFACIAIVFLHTFYASIAFSPSFTERTIAITVRNLMMWAVPCFVMVTGTLLLDKMRGVTYKKLFTKYIPRIALALIIFAVIFELLDTIAAGDAIGIGTFFTGIKNAVLGKSWSHMWYLYMVIGLYLLLPFYRKIAASLGKKDASYLIGIYIVFLSLLPMLETITTVKPAFYICVYTVYPLYLFLGYVIHQNLLSVPRWVWTLLAVLGTIAMGVLTVISEKTNSETLSKLLTNYAFPIIVLQSSGVYGMFSQKKAAFPKWLEFVLCQIDKCSFGIYLIHMIFLKVIMVYFKWDPYTHGGIFMVLLITLAVAIVSFVCVFLLKKIPGVKKLL